MNAHSEQLEKHLTLEEKRAKLGLGFRIRQWLASWLLDDVHLTKVHFGENTISMNPGGAGDVLRWSSAQDALAQLDIGMASDGKVSYHDGTQARKHPGEHLVMLLDGTQAMTANMPLGSNRITGLATPTATDDATTKAYVDGLVTGLQWIEPADCDDLLGNVLTTGLVGNASVATINGLSPSAGDAYVVTDAGTITAGSISTAIGDVVEYDGAVWVRLLAGSGGFVATSAMALSTTTALISPYTDSTDDGKIAVFDGTSLTGVLTTQATGNCLVVDGSAANGVDEGDVVEWNGSAWTQIVAATANFVTDGTRLVITTGTVLASGPFTSSTDEGKIATYDGTTNDGSTVMVTPVDGDAILINGEGANNENKAFVFDGTVPTGSWVQFAGSGGDHGSLSGLLDDDHTQYALLAGRAGGQSLVGGTASGEDLNLESTSNATKGDINIVSGTDVRMLGDDDFTPGTTGQGEIGTASLKFLAVNALTVTSGDHNFVHSERGVAWTATEFEDGLCLVNRRTGEWFKLAMEPIAARCPDSELAPIGDELANLAAK
jgi:hypothetical protein